MANTPSSKRKPGRTPAPAEAPPALRIAPARADGRLPDGEELRRSASLTPADQRELYLQLEQLVHAARLHLKDSIVDNWRDPDLEMETGVVLLHGALAGADRLLDSLWRPSFELVEGEARA